MAEKAEKFLFNEIFDAHHLQLHEPVYSRTQMDQMIAGHYQKGFEEGKAYASNDIDAMNGIHLENIHKKLKGILDIQNQMHITLEDQVASICRVMALKMLPALCEQGALEEIEHVIRKSFEIQERGNALKIYVADSCAGPLEQKLEEKGLGQQENLVLNIVGVDEMEPGDCRIEWEEGGIERRVDQIQDQIHRALERLEAVAVWKREAININQIDESMVEKAGQQCLLPIQE